MDAKILYQRTKLDDKVSQYQGYVFRVDPTSFQYGWKVVEERRLVITPFNYFCRGDKEFKKRLEDDKHMVYGYLPLFFTKLTPRIRRYQRIRNPRKFDRKLSNLLSYYQKKGFETPSPRTMRTNSYNGGEYIRAITKPWWQLAVEFIQA